MNVRITQFGRGGWTANERHDIILFMNTNRSWTNEQLIDTVASSVSIRQVLKKLGLSPSGGNYKQFHKYCLELKIDTSHFKGKGWSKGKMVGAYVKKDLKEITVINSNYQTYKLKMRLLDDGVFENRCARCGLTEWMGETIPIELDHINGISNDHRIENLRMLCPNCHSLTDTYRGRNAGK